MTARDRTMLIVVLIVGAIAGTWFMVIAPKRSEASSLQSQISAAQAQFDTARTTVAAGLASKSQFSASYATMVRLGEAVPADDQVSSLIFQVQSAAAASRVDFRSLTLAPSGGGSSAAATPTPGAVGASSALTTIPPGVTVGPAGFPTEPFTLTFTGNFFHLSDFFGRLQDFVTASRRRIRVSGRLMSLNAISLGPGPNGFPQIAATVSATTYLLPVAQGVQAGATPAAPAGVASQPVATGSPTTPVAPAAIVPAVK